jgi:serine/threonine-protein phosphatase 2A activator
MTVNDNSPELAHPSIIDENPKPIIPRLVPRSVRKTSTSKDSEPPPSTPILLDAPDPASQTFARPVKRILSPQDHQTFLESATYVLLQAWIFSLADSVRGLKISQMETQRPSEIVQQIDRILDRLESLFLQYPPLDTGSRFGNPVFKDFHQAISCEVDALHHEILHVENETARQELDTYLTNCFGSEERLDYGSGHELNFILWLLCLYQLNLIHPADFPAVVLHTFRRYLSLMRKIQSAYYLEPAGSHGVWGLDDYQFLPFLFGASQLVGHPYITPKAIHNNVILDEEGDDFLYLDQVRWVDSVKTVKGLRWHSPMLDDISGAKTWQKVEDGMRKMLIKEVFGKLPIMQHFLFGGMIPAAEEMGRLDPETERMQAERMKHVQEKGHEPDYWGDCCGIKVPSTIAAGEEMRKRILGGPALRPIPFD